LTLKNIYKYIYMESKNKKFFDGCSREIERNVHQRRDIIEEESFLLLPRINSKKFWNDATRRV
jgi:hypothetical protein